MGIAYTTNHRVPYMDPSTPFADVQLVTQQLAQLLDDAMSAAGYVPPGTASFAALAARVRAMAPQVFTDPSPSTTHTAPGPIVVHQRRVIDPAVLFGPGFGAVVQINAAVLLDMPSGATDGAWYLNVETSPQINTGGTPAVPSQMISQGYSVLSTGPRRTTILAPQPSQIIPAGLQAAYHVKLACPGAASTVKATTYADATSNRALYTVFPIPPTTAV